MFGSSSNTQPTTNIQPRGFSFQMGGVKRRTASSEVTMGKAMHRDIQSRSITNKGGCRSCGGAK